MGDSNSSMKQEEKEVKDVVTFTNESRNIHQKAAQLTEALIMECPKRTQGDGMENDAEDEIQTTFNKIRLGDTLIYHPTNLKQLESTPPVTPAGTIINLVPKNLSEAKKGKNLTTLKTKEPKFVPYEPYKAAVNPIVPLEKKTRKSRRSDLNVHVKLPLFHSIPKHTESSGEVLNDINKEEKRQTKDVNLGIKTMSYEADIHKLKEENDQLENQLKFQVQVNGELKNLLVAAVGEDLETKVHLLTEDKLQLARALLNSAQHLNTHQEQTEWLAGQCEVWRSKFLASSLMVEELARWKAALCQRTTDLQEAIKRLLEERYQIRDSSLKTYRTLRLLQEKFDPTGVTHHKKQELLSSNVLDLGKGCCHLAEALKSQLLSGVVDLDLHKDINITGLEMKTLGEKNAEQLLMNPNVLLSGRQDAVCTAVMGAAVAVGGKMFFPKSNSNIACCPHCSGEVKQV